MLIGISGKIGSGKDTLANLMIESDPSFIAKSFAYKLKLIVSILAGVPIELTMTQEGKNIMIPAFGITIGEMLQKVGTDAMRNGLDMDVWIKALFVDYKPEDPILFSKVGEPTTEIPFDINNKSHVDLLLGERLKTGVDPLPNWLITDTRFKNEADYIKDRGGILIRLEGDPARIREYSNRDMTHPSETDLDDYLGFDIVYQNTGSLLDLKQFAQQLCRLKEKV